MIVHSHQVGVSNNKDIGDYEKTYSPGYLIYVAPQFGEGLVNPNAGPKYFFEMKKKNVVLLSEPPRTAA